MNRELKKEQKFIVIYNTYELIKNIISNDCKFYFFTDRLFYLRLNIKKLFCLLD